MDAVADPVRLSLPAARTTRKSVRALVPNEVVRELSRPNVWRALAAIATQYILVAAAIALSVWADSWFMTIPVLFFIATRQHGLLVMQHEASHWLISHNRTLNDTICNLFCSMPFFVSARRYRDNHIRHHHRLNAHDDPDLDDNIAPPTLGRLALLILMDLSFISLPKAMRRSRKFGVSTIFIRNGKGFAYERFLFLGLVTTVASTLTWFHAWPQFLLYWVVPLASTLQVILRLRGYSEHAGRMEGDYLHQARTIDVSFLERVIFAPLHVNRHLEHHLYPSIPFHKMDALRAALHRNPDYVAWAKPTDGYVMSGRSMLWEIYGDASPASAVEAPARSL
jgi:fatty acid desaturase